MKIFISEKYGKYTGGELVRKRNELNFKGDLILVISHKKTFINNFLYKLFGLDLKILLKCISLSTELTLWFDRPSFMLTLMVIKSTKKKIRIITFHHNDEYKYVNENSTSKYKIFLKYIAKLQQKIHILLSDKNIFISRAEKNNLSVKSYDIVLHPTFKKEKLNQGNKSRFIFFYSDYLANSSQLENYLEFIRSTSHDGLIIDSSKEGLQQKDVPIIYKPENLDDILLTRDILYAVYNDTIGFKVKIGYFLSRNLRVYCSRLVYNWLLLELDDNIKELLLLDPAELEEPISIIINNPFLHENLHRSSFN